MPYGRFTLETASKVGVLGEYQSGNVPLLGQHIGTALVHTFTLYSSSCFIFVVVAPSLVSILSLSTLTLRHIFIRRRVPGGGLGRGQGPADCRRRP